jgi:sugar phosphate isomerase/epimerase
MPLEELAAKTAAWGFDGLELACWGDHFEVDRALVEPGYVDKKRLLLARHGLQCWTLGAHLVGQAVCDRIDAATAKRCRRRYGATATRQAFAGGRASDYRTPPAPPPRSARRR